MAELSTCPSCRGLCPPRAECCPNCGARVALSPVARAALAAGSGLAMLTLMACYGAGPLGKPTPSPSPGPSSLLPDGGKVRITQYCGLPDGGTPVPCDELDAGASDGGASDGG
jgi:hypothetical protein